MPAPAKKNVVLCVLDGFGIGGAPDAQDYGDQGANTLGHIAAHCAAHCAAHRGGSENREGGAQFRLETMMGLGLGAAAQAAAGEPPAGLHTKLHRNAIWGCATERSRGKDTPSGHWEIAGLPVEFDWGYFPSGPPSFPSTLINALTKRGQLPGILGNKAASGTDIIAELGQQHCRSGAPICYTSQDSVFQIAAHEEAFGLERLYRICAIARELTLPLNIGRVIARPFTGAGPDEFRRTANRRDFAIAPTGATLLDRIYDAGGAVCAIGKIWDIFSGRGIAHHIKGADNDALFDGLLNILAGPPRFDLIFANFVDFDMKFGHRRDIPGFADALEAFDRRLPALIDALAEDDLLILTADHGCDPSWRGNDHTRERVPILCYCRAWSKIADGPIPIGIRDSFADISASILEFIGLPPGPYGKSFCANGQMQRR